MSLFVRVNCNYFQHRKVARLRARIGNDALWLPIRLWVYVAENHPDGELPADTTSEELAALLGYNGDASSMLQALLQAGFLDDSPLRVHDWEEHNGYHKVFAERAKKAAAARWAKGRTPAENRDGDERRGEEASNASSIPEASPQRDSREPWKIERDIKRDIAATERRRDKSTDEAERIRLGQRIDALREQLEDVAPQPKPKVRRSVI